MVLFFTALDCTSITSHIHKWVLFFLCLWLFILPGVISPLISSSILGTYQPGEFIFQCPLFLPFHTVHGVLKATLKRFAIPFPSGPRFVRTFHHDPSVLGAPSGMAHSFIELDEAVVHMIGLVSYLPLKRETELCSRSQRMNSANSKTLTRAKFILRDRDAKFSA